MTAKKMEAIIFEDGWYLIEIRGSHHQYKHPIKQGKVTIPFHSKPKDLNSKTLQSIFKQAQLDMRNYV